MQVTEAQRTAAVSAPNLKALLMVALIVTGTLGVVLLGHRVNFDSAWVWKIGYPAIFLLGVMSAAGAVLPIPILPIVFAGSAFMDPYGVALSAASGMTIGMVLTYLVGKLGQRKMAKLLQNGEHWAAKWGQWALRHYRRRTVISSFVIAVIPNPIYAYSGIITGSMRVSMRRFCFGTFAGNTVQALIVALAGFYAGSLPFHY